MRARHFASSLRDWSSTSISDHVGALSKFELCGHTFFPTIALVILTYWYNGLQKTYSHENSIVQMLSSWLSCLIYFGPPMTAFSHVYDCFSTALPLSSCGPQILTVVRMRSFVVSHPSQLLYLRMIGHIVHYEFATMHVSRLETPPPAPPFAFVEAR
jgi:hypothetical protein